MLPIYPSLHILDLLTSGQNLGLLLALSYGRGQKQGGLRGRSQPSARGVVSNLGEVLVALLTMERFMKRCVLTHFGNSGMIKTAVSGEFVSRLETKYCWESLGELYFAQYGTLITEVS